jgi:hypothetical protein
MRDEDTSAQVLRRRIDLDEKLAPPWSGEPADRRALHRDHERRQSAALAPSKRLTRSAYEKVFLKLVGGGSLRIGDERLTPVKVQGWYHSIFRNQNGEERMLSIDQLLLHMGSWE